MQIWRTAIAAGKVAQARLARDFGHSKAMRRKPPAGHRYDRMQLLTARWPLPFDASLIS
jgi:hypothetical protein